MMIEKNIKNKFCVILLLLILLPLPGCKEDDYNASEENVISSISVMVASRAEGDEDTNDKTDAEEKPGESSIAPYEIPFSTIFDENSVIFVSQQTNQTVPFKTSDAIYPYGYKKDYIPNPNPGEDWYDDNVYNFTPISDNPLEWFKIGNTGSYLSGFYLYALYFPTQNEINQREENGNILYHVEGDQSTLENLTKSDILGAFHSSPTLFSRLSFRLFHLMTYVGVRLYVPVYDENTKTGYYDDALISASLENVSPEFSIQWTHVINSDLDGPRVNPTQGTEKIKMYQHPLRVGITKREIVKIEYESFHNRRLIF